MVFDDQQEANALADQLRVVGYRVDLADGRDRIETVVDAHRPQLILVGLSADDLTRGWALGERIRRTDSTPFVFVGAWLSHDDRLRSFDAGAEDVIWLPCPTDELRARLGVVLRHRGHRGDVLEFDDIVVDLAAHAVVRARNPVPVTSIEFLLLSALMRHRGRVLSKTHLLNDVWGYERYDVNLVEVHVSSLRRKLEAFGPRVLHTVRGAGYVLRPAPAVTPTAV